MFVGTYQSLHLSTSLSKSAGNVTLSRQREQKWNNYRSCDRAATDDERRMRLLRRWEMSSSRLGTEFRSDIACRQLRRIFISPATLSLSTYSSHSWLSQKQNNSFINTGTRTAHLIRHNDDTYYLHTFPGLIHTSRIRWPTLFYGNKNHQSVKSALCSLHSYSAITLKALFSNNSNTTLWCSPCILHIFPWHLVLLPIVLFYHLVLFYCTVHYFVCDLSAIA